MKRILAIVLLLGGMGYVLLAFGMDVSYDPDVTQSSSSSSEAVGRKTLVTRLTPDKYVFKVAGAEGKIKDLWIERNWGYQPHGLLDRLRGIYPTTLMPGAALVVAFEGDSSIKSHLIRWEFALSGGGGGSFGGGIQAIPLEENTPLPTQLLIRERFGKHNSQSATVDSITLRH